jgi:3-phenylpropionate/trans-cinnamate dioxygenase ferredoxin reductase subunit
VSGPLVVVGGSLAGLRAVQELRARDYRGELVVVAAEPGLPYDRTLLSKEMLAGRIPPGGELLFDRAGMTALSVRWLAPRRATGLSDPPLRVLLDGGEAIRAAGVVIATGARARPLPSLPGAHLLRTRADCARLRTALATPTALTVVGAGLIGGEVAATAALAGHQVTIVEALDSAFDLQFGPLLAARLRTEHEKHGVRLLTGAAATSLSGGMLELSTGERLETGVLLVGIGAVPEVDWLAGSGVDTDGGVRTDGWGRTSLPGVVAAGDVARYDSARYGGAVRVEHWTNARDMPAVAVRALLADLGLGGDPGPRYDPVPYFWSSQYGQQLQVAGRPGSGDRVDVVEGDVEDRFAAVELAGDRLVAALGWQQPKAFARLRRELGRVLST